MAKNRNSFKAGLFIVASIVAALGVVVGIKGLGTFVDPIEHRYVRFTLRDDVGGLRVGDDLRIGGFKVGEVTNIALVAADDRRLAKVATTVPAIADGQPALLVTVTIPKRIVIREGVRVEVQTTVTGQSALNLDSLGSGQPLAADVAMVGRPGALSELLASAPELGDKVRGILTQLNDQTLPTVNGALVDVRGKTIPKVNDTVDSYRETAKEGTTLLQKVREYLKPVVEKYYTVADSASSAVTKVGDVFGESKTDFKGTIANLNASTAAIREKLPGILDKTDGIMKKIDGVIVSAGDAMSDVKITLENTKDISAAARSAVAGNRSKIDGMVTSLKSTSDNLKAMSAELRRNPWRLLYAPKKEELGNLALYDSARQFAEGAQDLNDAAQALRDGLKDKHSSEADLKRLMERVDKSFANFGEVEKKLWSNVKD